MWLRLIVSLLSRRSEAKDLLLEEGCEVSRPGSQRVMAVRELLVGQPFAGIVDRSVVNGTQVRERVTQARAKGTGCGGAKNTVFRWQKQHAANPLTLAALQQIV